MGQQRTTGKQLRVRELILRNIKVQAQHVRVHGLLCRQFINQMLRLLIAAEHGEGVDAQHFGDDSFFCIRALRFALFKQGKAPPADFLRGLPCILRAVQRRGEVMVIQAPCGQFE